MKKILDSTGHALVLAAVATSADCAHFEPGCRDFNCGQVRSAESPHTERRSRHGVWSVLGPEQKSGLKRVAYFAQNRLLTSNYVVPIVSSKQIHGLMPKGRLCTKVAVFPQPSLRQIMAHADFLSPLASRYRWTWIRETYAVDSLEVDLGTYANCKR